MLFLLEGRVVVPNDLSRSRRSAFRGPRRRAVIGTGLSHLSRCARSLKTAHFQSMTRAVPYADVVSRVTELEALAASTRGQTTAPPPASGGGFASALAAASSPANADPSVTPDGSAAGRLVTAAESQVGQAEAPPGSNDGPAIATYRSAVAGAQAGQPWCAYFVSWAAAQAGTPLGDTGAVIGSVSEITSWAQRTGTFLPAGSTPQPGDLILFGTEHVGLVESVNLDGSLTTIEGNSSDAVSRVNRMPGEATGFVRLNS